ncbi:MAG: hypothetical protein ACRBCI_00555 [Cellvibrionaceae bacterium]
MFFSKTIASGRVENGFSIDEPWVAVGFDVGNSCVNFEKADVDWLNSGFDATAFLNGYNSRCSINVENFMDQFSTLENSATKLVACVYGDAWQRNDFFSREFTNSHHSLSVLRPACFNGGVKRFSDKTGVGLDALCSAAINTYLQHCSTPLAAINVNVSNRYLLNSMRHSNPLLPVIFLVCEPALMLANWLNSDLDQRYKLVDRFARESGIVSYEDRQALVPLDAFFGILEAYYQKLIDMSNTIVNSYIFDNTLPHIEAFTVLSGLMDVSATDVMKAHGHIVSDSAQMIEIQKKIEENSHLVPDVIKEQFSKIQQLESYLGTGL